MYIVNCIVYMYYILYIHVCYRIHGVYVNISLFI